MEGEVRGLEYMKGRKNMSIVENITAEAQTLAPELQMEVLDFLRFLKVRSLGYRFESILKSASILREWESPEEEEAWKYLQEPVPVR